MWTASRKNGSPQQKAAAPPTRRQCALAARSRSRAWAWQARRARWQSWTRRRLHCSRHGGASSFRPSFAASWRRGRGRLSVPTKRARSSSNRASPWRRWSPSFRTRSCASLPLPRARSLATSTISRASSRRPTTRSSRCGGRWAARSKNLRRPSGRTRSCRPAPMCSLPSWRPRSEISTPSRTTFG